MTDGPQRDAAEMAITIINREVVNPTETERLRAALDVAISALAGAPLERDTRDLEDAVDRAQKALSERMDEQAAKP